MGRMFVGALFVSAAGNHIGPLLLYLVIMIRSIFTELPIAFIYTIPLSPYSNKEYK